MMKFLRYILVLLVAVSPSAHSQKSQFVDVLDGRFDVSDYLSENAYGFLPVPVIITDPAVDGGLGMAGIFFHETEEERDQRMQAMRNPDKDASRHLLPPSLSVVAGAYTGNESWFVGGGHLGFFFGDKLRYSIFGGYGNVNLDFYGTGEINLRRPLELNTEASALFQKLKVRIPESHWFVGIAQRYIDGDTRPNTLGDFDSIIPPEWQEPVKNILRQKATLSGMGFNFEYDSRDNLFSPRTGFKYELEHLWYRDEIGSDVEYNLTTLEGLNYWQFKERWLLGIKVASEYADSAQLLPTYANPSIDLRGIPSARYQGESVAQAEVELGWLLDNRWKLLAFTGAGRTSLDYSDLSSAQSQVAKGVGFRYQIARRYGFDMGVDVAKGPEESVFYITAGSSW